VNYYVNLRCMQIFDDHVELYLGGGITRDSDPLVEWDETEEKAKVLFSVLS
jgi:isochorismate synthase